MPYFLAPLWKTELSSLSTDDLWEHFEKCLNAHDWTYNYSDDPGVWRAGEEQKKHLHRVFETVRTLDKERAERMYNTKHPWKKADGTQDDNW